MTIGFYLKYVRNLGSQSVFIWTECFKKRSIVIRKMRDNYEKYFLGIVNAVGRKVHLVKAIFLTSGYIYIS